MARGLAVGQEVDISALLRGAALMDEQTRQPTVGQGQVAAREGVLTCVVRGGDRFAATPLLSWL